MYTIIKEKRRNKKLNIITINYKLKNDNNSIAMYRFLFKTHKQKKNESYSTKIKHNLVVSNSMPSTDQSGQVYIQFGRDQRTVHYTHTHTHIAV